jgi:ComEC/Rec2-related protein
MSIALALISMTFGRGGKHARFFGWLAVLAVYAAVFFSGFLSAAVSMPGSQVTDAAGSPGSSTEQIEVVGVVTGDPDVLPSTRSGRVAARFPLRIDRLDDVPVPGLAEGATLQVFCYGAEDDVRVPLYGEKWRFRGSVLSGAADRQEKKGSYRRTSQCLRTNFRNAQFISDGHGWRIAESCFAARKAAAEYLSAGISEHKQAVAIMESLLLGYRRLSFELRQVFVFTGTLHIFAISGSHVVVMASIVLVVLGIMRISSIHWVLFMGPFLCMYTFATGMQSSAVRACIMAIVFWGAPLLGRRADSLSALAVSAVLIVAVVPSQLFDSGFVLSFTCVLGLIALYPVFNSPVQKLLQPDPLRLQPEPVLMRGMRTAGSWLWSSVAMSCSAWLVSAPLTAWYFCNFTPIGLVSNLIVIPVSFFVILAGCLSLVLGACVYELAVIFNHANLVLVELLVRSMQFMASLPCANIKVEPPPVWMIVLWYALLMLWVFERKRKPTPKAQGDSQG